MMTYTGAVYSLLFLFRPRKNFALLSGGYKVLAIISATILNLATAYSILLIVLVSTGRIHNHMIVGTNRNDAIGLQGAETWTVDGSEWKITATYFMGNGHRLMYVIECQYPNPIAIKSREEAVQIYFPLVRHAIQNRRHERWKELKPPPALDLTYVGVVLVKWHGIQYEKYSDSISLAEIQARLAGFDGSLQNPEHLTSHGLQLRQ